MTGLLPLATLLVGSIVYVAAAAAECGPRRLLLGLALLVGGALVVDRLRTRSPLLLDGATTDQIVGLRIDALTLRRMGLTWQIVDGAVNRPADDRRVQSLLSALALARWQRHLDPLPLPITATVAVEVESHPAITLTFHGAAPDGIYVERAGEWGVTESLDLPARSTLFAVAAPLVARAPLLPWPVEAVTGIELSWPGRTVALTRRDLSWQSGDHPVDDRRVHDLLIAWSKMTGGVVSASPAPLGSLRITTAQDAVDYQLSPAPTGLVVSHDGTARELPLDLQPLWELSATPTRASAADDRRARP